MKQLDFRIALRMGQINMVSHNITCEISARNIRRIEKKNVKKQCNRNATQLPETDKEI